MVWSLSSPVALRCQPFKEPTATLTALFEFTFCQTRESDRIRSHVVSWPTVGVFFRTVILLCCILCCWLFYLVCVFSCTVLIVGIRLSQVIGCEDCLRNDLDCYCVGWDVKPYSNNKKSDPLFITRDYKQPGAFLAAAVCGGQRGGQICIWGGPRIPDDIMHD